MNFSKLEPNLKIKGLMFQIFNRKNNKIRQIQFLKDSAVINFNEFTNRTISLSLKYRKSLNNLPISIRTVINKAY